MNQASLKRLKFSNFKLDSLLEITLAINNNVPTQELFEKYKNLLLKDLNLGSILVYNYSEKWKVLLNAGPSKDQHKSIDITKDLLPLTEITTTFDIENSPLEVFDVIIPVYHNNKPLAFVLIGDLEEEQEGISPTIKHLHFIQTFTNIIMVAVENRRLYEESLVQEAMKKELELASKIQSMLIPNAKSFPHNNKISVDAYYKPHFDVGGDYYDFWHLNDNEFGFCIADVSGKGISAAILMSNFQANLRALFTSEIPLSLLISKLNERVIRNSNIEKFITLFLGKYCYATNTLHYINAGHNPPFLYQKDSDTFTYLRNGCVGLGMLDEIPKIEEGKIVVKNAKLLCYTDGLVELEYENKVEDASTTVIETISNDKSIEDSINDLIDKLNVYQNDNKLFDDITILGIDIH